MNGSRQSILKTHKKKKTALTVQEQNLFYYFYIKSKVRVSALIFLLGSQLVHAN
jgi:hypothetical protein